MCHSPFLHPPPLFFFASQLRGQSYIMLMMITPLPHYDNFSTNFFRSGGGGGGNVSAHLPPPPPPPTERRFFYVDWLPNSSTLLLPQRLMVKIMCQ